MMLKEGGKFGDYTVVRLLGKGGMGEVWLLETSSGGKIAAKILDPATATDHESRRRFLREAELTMGVKHPNLVTTYDVGEDPETGLCYLLMEYVAGGTLAGLLKREGALPIKRAIEIVRAMADVLELGRQKGIVHRDIKPENIMFSADGTPKLVDMGIARSGVGGTEATTMTRADVLIGTPAYMAPEQMMDSHHVDTRADIYSLGIVFYEMLSGQRPHGNDTLMQLMAKAMKGEALPDVRTLRPEVSASLAQLLNMMVAPVLEKRIQTPGQITKALDFIRRGGHLAPPKQSRPRAPVETKAKRRFPAWVIPVVLLMVLAGVLAILMPKGVFKTTANVGSGSAAKSSSSAVKPLVSETPSPSDDRDRTPPDTASTAVSPSKAVLPAGVVKVGESHYKFDGPEGEWVFGGLEKGELWLGGREGGPALYPMPSGKLRLPVTLAGLPVVGILMDGFKNCRELTEVEVPEGFRHLGQGAFVGCSALERVSLPKSIASIDSYAFSGTRIRFLDLNRTSEWNPKVIANTPCLEEVAFDSRNNQFVREDGLVFGRDQSKLLFVPRSRTELTLPPNVKVVEKFAAEHCALQTLVLPRGLRAIGEEAFAHCDRLRRLEIEEPNLFIATKAFLDATNLVELKLAEGRKSLNGTLVFGHCRSLREVTLPSTLEALGMGVFDGASSLERVELGRSLRHIGFRAFADATRLKSIRLPATLREVESQAFKGCRSLRQVWFEGDAPELKDLSWGPRGMNIFMDTPQDLIVYVKRGSRGWNPNGGELPRKWPVDADRHARMILYDDDPSAAGGPRPSLTSTPPGWVDDLEAAKAQARREKKQILAAFTGSDWCGWCVKMKEDVYSKPEFLPTVTNRFVPFYVDSPRDRSLLRDEVRQQNPKLHGEYGIRGVPCVLILDEDGKEIGRTGGYKRSLDDLVERINAIRGVLPEQIMTKSGPLDSSQLEDSSCTERAKKALKAFFPEWTLESAVLQERDERRKSGYHKFHRGRSNVVVLHPQGHESPAVLSGTFALSRKHPCLAIETSSWTAENDFLLSVTVNGREALPPRLVCTPDASPWERILVPLSRWKGQKATIKIVLEANDWNNENPFIGGIELVEGTGREQAGAVGVETREIFPRANPKSSRWRQRTPWRYTVRDPEAGWNDADFDDSKWKRTKKALGCNYGPNMIVADNWRADRIWIRQTFDWDSAESVHRVVLDLFYDQDIEIYLNGKLVFNRGGWNSTWTPYAIPAKDFADALRQGKNVLAVTLKGDSNNFFDCGLTIETRRENADR